MNNSIIDRIEWTLLTGTRPRNAGCNSRLGEHGTQVRLGIARITADSGATGFGWSPITKEQAHSLVGIQLSRMFDPEHGVDKRFRVLEYPLWDLAGQLTGEPVYAMLGGKPDSNEGFRVPCYDTSLYIDDLHLKDDNEAAALIASEALEGMARGHRAFKIKVGRGAMHMPLEKGTARDVLVIRAVREAVGEDAVILIDANNGYNLSLTKRVLGRSAEANVYWIEEAFHEDPKFYASLREWLDKEGLETRIADGEGDASPNLVNWAREGLIDIIQYDIFNPGFTHWIQLGPQLDAWEIGTAPHHYGGHYGNFAAAHLAAKVRRFEFVEWDEAQTAGLDASDYEISEGRVNVPDTPGFGLRLDEEVFAKSVAADGFVVSR
ncbi:MAG: mandelate racemase [Candidatus Poribacteria bacterium]|nr:mandelate racemase [Candidatus Poribacteria bacterium]MDE0504254.1 mandelate racemase [Candidatus Poribacteria bacterium]